MANRILIVAFDGLQPAQVTPELMPNLAAFAGEGVTFQNHHSVFPTVTRINAVSMTTGRYPGGHGLAANSLVVRDFDPDRAIQAMKPDLDQLKEKTGRVLLVPNLADILGGLGREYIALGVGSNGNAYLHNPNAERSGGATIHPEFCLPEGLYDEVIERFGPWQAKTRPDNERLAHAVRIMTEYVLPERDPAVALLWCSEPDSVQHAAGVGSELGNRALAGVDRQFGRLLEWLEESGRAAETDVIVISDHGYSTIRGSVEIEELVRDAWFPAGGHPGGVIVVPQGSAVLFYVHQRDRATADRLSAWLMAQPWCGPIVASEAVGRIEGTLPAALVGAEGDRAPDLAMSFAWDSEPNGAGFEGYAYSSSGAPGLGQHGSMSKHEQRCVLLAGGPSFKRGIALDTPSGNVDLTPTVLNVLGIPGGGSMDGRVLEEALLDGPAPDYIDRSINVHHAERKVDSGIYRQQITVSRAGKTSYVDEGSASLDTG